MEISLRTLQLLLLLVSIPFASALKFDIQAHAGHESAKHERCVRNFVAKDQLVVVTAIVSGHRGDGQMLNMHVCRLLLDTLKRALVRVLTAIARQIKDAVGNQYGKPKDVAGENRYAFTSLADSAFDVCFENILTSSAYNPSSAYTTS